MTIPPHGFRPSTPLPPPPTDAPLEPQFLEPATDDSGVVCPGCTRRVDTQGHCGGCS